MFVVRNYVTMCGTVACALSIGYLMQNGFPAPSDDAQIGVSVASAADQASVLAGLEDIVLTSSSPSEPNPGTGSSATRGLQPTPNAPREHLNCNISARAFAMSGAHARLSIKAPCHSNERLEIHHSGLTITQQTDEMGALNVTIPALSEYAIFLISFDDQAGTVATTHIPDIVRYDRFALQWQGDIGLQLHALEFGAAYGDAGHVWAGDQQQGAGSVVHLGHPGFEAAQNVEVYSFPAHSAEQSGTIALTVEAEVTDANCGRDLNVHSLELRADRRLRSRALTLTMPMCTQVGEFLVLNNLFQDLTIAAK